jgi:hypothetical protein
MSNYTLVEANDRDMLTRQVNDRIEQGCDLQGGISISTLSNGSVQYAQAVICPVDQRKRPRVSHAREGGGKRYTKSSKKRSGKMTRRH